MMSFVQFFSLDDLRRLLASMFITIDLVLVGVFTIYSFVHYHEARLRNNLAVQAALSLDMYFFGRLILQVYGWFGPTINAEGTYTVQFNRTIDVVVPLIGSFITVIGAAWVAWVFTPKSWRLRGWALVLISVALFLALTWRL